MARRLRNAIAVMAYFGGILALFALIWWGLSFVPAGFFR